MFISSREANLNNLSQTRNTVKEASKCIGTNVIRGETKGRRGHATECKAYHTRLYELSRISARENNPIPLGFKYGGNECLRLTAAEHECPRKSPEQHDERMGDDTYVKAKGSTDLPKGDHTGSVTGLEMTDCKSLSGTSQYTEAKEMLSDTQKTSDENTLLKYCSMTMHQKGSSASIPSGTQSGVNTDPGFASYKIQDLDVKTLCSELNSVCSEHTLDVTNVDCPIATRLHQIDLIPEIQDGGPLLSEGSTLQAESLEISDSETLTGGCVTDLFQTGASQECVNMNGKDVT